ncbi:MAG: hypothetical protein Q8Q95_04640 [bacterium]|nr:hypothetical protein [bacterium]
MASTADLFQFVFLIVRSIFVLIGPKPIEDIFLKNRLEDQFSINAGGNLEIKFESSDPAAINYYLKLLEALARLAKNVFGKQYANNLFLQHYEKIKSWSQTSEETETIKQVLDKITKDA